MMSKSLYPQRRIELRDVPHVALNSDGVYLVTIILTVLVFSVMVGVYLWFWQYYNLITYV